MDGPEPMKDGVRQLKKTSNCISFCLCGLLPSPRKYLHRHLHKNHSALVQQPQPHSSLVARGLRAKVHLQLLAVVLTSVSAQGSPAKGRHDGAGQGPSSHGKAAAAEEDGCEAGLVAVGGTAEGQKG